MFYSPIFGICFQLPIICAEERIHITKSKEPDSTGDLLNLDSDAEHQSEKSEHPVQLNKILNYWQLVRVAYKIKILHCGILICRSGTQLSWQSTRLISERSQVQFLPFRLRDKCKAYLGIRKVRISPFATRTFLLRTVRDRPVAFAAKYGKAEDRLVLDDGCPVIC